MFYQFLITFKDYFMAIFPWFLVGIVLAYLLDRKINKSTIHRYFSGITLKKLFSVQIIGMISPLSIMSFMPMANELAAMGFNPGLLLSFFIAERAYDLQSFFIISSLFGIRFALLNALAILVSLVATALFLKHEFVRFTLKDKTIRSGYWRRQGKLMLLVIVGIFVGSLLKTFIPQSLFLRYAGGSFNGLFVSLVLGFIFYFGPILGNYPVAKAFSELGMSTLGTFSFLTVSPILNLVVFFIFSATIGTKPTLRALIVYSGIALLMSFLCSFLL